MGQLSGMGARSRARLAGEILMRTPFITRMPAVLLLVVASTIIFHMVAPNSILWKISVVTLLALDVFGVYSIVKWEKKKRKLPSRRQA